MATRIAVTDGLDPVASGLGREVVAAVLAGVALAVARAAPPAGRQWRQVAVVAAAVVVGWPVLISLALERLPAAHGAVVSGLLPALTAACAVLRARERGSPAFWLASAAGTAAVVAFAFTRDGGAIGLAHLAMLAAVVLCAAGYAEGAMLARELGAWQVLSWALVVSAPLIAPVAAWRFAATGIDATAEAWAAFGYVSVISAFLGLLAWYRGLALGGIARIGQLQLCGPVLGLVWAAVFLGEDLGAATVLAAIAVLASATLVQRTRVT